MSYAAYRQSEGFHALDVKIIWAVSIRYQRQEKLVNFVTRRIEFFQLNQVVAREGLEPPTPGL